MTTYTIGQVAGRSGFSTSALRYYEKHGLVTPVKRTDAGYRLYDDTTLARLSFIDRAKQLGCTLDETAELTELWADEDCGPVQARLHQLVTDKIADAQRRSAELLRFTAQLQSAASHLGAEPTDGPCDEWCACLTKSATDESVPVEIDSRGDRAIACALPGDEMPGRLAEWRAVLAHVTRRESTDGGLRLVLGEDVALGDLTRLAAAEQECCTFFAFAITIDDRGVALEVRAPESAADLVAAVFGATEERGRPVGE